MKINGNCHLIDRFLVIWALQPYLSCVFRVNSERRACISFFPYYFLNAIKQWPASVFVCEYWAHICLKTGMHVLFYEPMRFFAVCKDVYWLYLSYCVFLWFAPLTCTRIIWPNREQKQQKQEIHAVECNICIKGFSKSFRVMLRMWQCQIWCLHPSQFFGRLGSLQPVLLSRTACNNAKPRLRHKSWA